MREIKYTDSELKAKMAKFEAKLKPRQKIVAYLREVTDNPSLYFEQEEEPPQWLKKVADVMIMAEIAENDYLRIGSKGTMPNWVNAVIKINTNSITHLDQIRWETATAQWRTDVAKAIVECLECDALKVPVVECMLGQWREATDGELSFDIGQPFDKFCTHLITNIQNHDLYSIEAIKARQNDRLKAVEDRVSRLELPDELQNDEAQTLLKRAVEAGLCKPDGQGRYKWLNDIQLCAYFCAKMSDYLELSKRLQDNKRVTNWRPFVTLFGYSADQLKSAKQGYSKDGRHKPTDHKTVDDLFEE